MVKALSFEEQLAATLLHRFCQDLDQRLRQVVIPKYTGRVLKEQSGDGILPSAIGAAPSTAGMEVPAESSSKMEGSDREEPCRWTKKVRITNMRKLIFE
jgi:hypothetical protein